MRKRRYLSSESWGGRRGLTFLKRRLFGPAMGRGDRDESVSPRRRIMMAPVKNLPQQQQHQHHGGGRSASVSPRRNFVPRNASPSPR